MPKITRIIGLCTVILVLLLGLVFHFKNNEPIALDYYFNIFQLPFSLWMMIAFIMGIITGLMITVPIILKFKYRNHQLQKQATKSHHLAEQN